MNHCVDVNVIILTPNSHRLDKFDETVLSRLVIQRFKTPIITQ